MEEKCRLCDNMNWYEMWFGEAPLFHKLRKLDCNQHKDMELKYRILDDRLNDKIEEVEELCKDDE